jgi:hypothetical protein
VAQTSPSRAGLLAEGAASTDLSDGSTPAWLAALDDAPSREGSGFVAEGRGVQDATIAVMWPIATTRIQTMRGLACSRSGRKRHIR